MAGICEQSVISRPLPELSNHSLIGLPVWHGFLRGLTSSVTENTQPAS